MFDLTSTCSHLESTFSKLLNITEDNDVVRSSLPAELLDHIIDDLHDNTAALCVMGLVSRRTMIRSRRYLLSALEFNRNDGRFDAFLDLLDHASWTTFSFVESIHITDLFRPRWYKYRIGRDVRRMTAQLPNLKSVWLTSTQSWQISWNSIPIHVRQLFLGLNLRELQIDSLLYHRADWAELFTIIKGSVVLTLYNLEFGSMDDLTYLSGILRQPISFGSLDTSSILPLEAVWNLSILNGLHITVDTFHLRPLQLPSWNRDRYMEFVSQRFLRNVGPSIRRLFVGLSGPYFSPGTSFPPTRQTKYPQNTFRTTFLVAIQCYDVLDLSQCIHIRVAQFGCIPLGAGEETKSRMAVMWKLLLALPPSIEEIAVTVGPKDEFKDAWVQELVTFSWMELVDRLKRTFTHLKTVVIGVGTYRSSCTLLPLPTYLERLRSISGVKEHEEAGLLRLKLIHWDAQSAWDELPWRQVIGKV